MPSDSDSWITIESFSSYTLLRLHSRDEMNRLTLRLIRQATDALCDSARCDKPLIIKGNQQTFSAGADLNEIAALSAPEAFEFAKVGQQLMSAIANFPAPTFAAICGYCMGGGLDLALACRCRVAAPNAVFGHRGAALGLMTGWGGTQRLARLLGKARALQMFCAAEKLDADAALKCGLLDAIAKDPVAHCVLRLEIEQKLRDP